MICQVLLFCHDKFNGRDIFVFVTILISKSNMAAIAILKKNTKEYDISVTKRAIKLNNISNLYYFGLTNSMEGLFCIYASLPAYKYWPPSPIKGPYPG